RVGEDGQLVAIDEEAQEKLIVCHLPDRFQALCQSCEIDAGAALASAYLHRVTPAQTGALCAAQCLQKFIGVLAAGGTIRLAWQLNALAGVLPQVQPEHLPADFIAVK